MTSIDLQQVYGDDATYLDEDSAAALSGLPAEAFPALVEACEEMEWGAEPGIDCDVTKTFETIDDFHASRRDHWREKGGMHTHKLSGYDAVSFHKLQLIKGEERQNMIVVDCGDCRAVLSLSA